MDPPSIAAIIPLYNGAAHIEAALRSVLAQTLPASEIIVVDDGSTDAGPKLVAAIAAEHPVRLLRKPNGGQSSARNHGVSHCNSDLIALLDQDDIWYPHHLRQLVRPFLRPQPVPLGWVYSNLDEVDARGGMEARGYLSSLPTAHPKRDLRRCLREDMFILPSAALISRAAFQAVGGFDERLSGYEDDDLFLRLFRAGYDNLYLDQPLSQWRMHPASASGLPAMAASRAIYVRKLMAEFPDDPERGRFYTRDQLAPRFFTLAMVEYSKALRAGRPEGIRAAFAELAFLARHLHPARRLVLTPALALLRVTPLARLVFACRAPLRPLARRLAR